jgi:hypothetical protein
MLSPEVNITQNNRQTPIHGGSDIFADIFLFFAWKYLHFSNIILNTHTQYGQGIFCHAPTAQAGNPLPQHTLRTIFSRQENLFSASCKRGDFIPPIQHDYSFKNNKIS